MNETANKLRWHKFPVLNDGYVCLVDVMGDDMAVVNAARISYNKDSRDDGVRLLEKLHKLYPNSKSKFDADKPAETVDAYLMIQQTEARKEIDADARKLLRLLMRSSHSTPFESCELKFLIRLPIDAMRQHVRHRVFSLNEYSTRYTEAIDSRQETPSDAWRLQSSSNKQGSSGLLEEWPEDWPMTTEDFTPGQYLSAKEHDFHNSAIALYQERLKFGVAREQARKDLPLSTYTEAYWKGNLHNLLHYLGLRLDSHAQLEIRLYAQAIAGIVKQLFPWTWEAFIDYRFESVTLSRLDVIALKSLLTETASRERFNYLVSNDVMGDSRERTECFNKLVQLRVCE